MRPRLGVPWKNTTGHPDSSPTTRARINRPATDTSTSLGTSRTYAAVAATANPSRKELTACGRRTLLAVTYVGGPRTVVCSSTIGIAERVRARLRTLLFNTRRESMMMSAFPPGRLEPR
jgi:hypothetical protein